MSDNHHNFAPLFDRLRAIGGEDQQSPARTLGRFRLGETLGAGRFAVVVAADDPQLNRQVALKIPHRDLLAENRLRDRFIREAHAVARLDHPGIVPLLEVVHSGDEVACLVLGRVNGPTLEQWLEARDAEVPIRMACQIVAALADAIQHAHEQHVLHLDLKPSNILIAPGNEPVPEVGQPKVADFGLARLLDEKRKSTADRAGTEGYMAPEQTLDKKRNDLTTAADIWALGVILYQLLANRLPFNNNVELASPEVDPTPLRLLRSEVNRELEAVVLKCLEKKPESRYASAAELAQDLRAVLDRTPTRARPLNQIERLMKKVRRRPTETLLAAFLLMAMIVGPVGIVLHLEIRREKQTQVELADALGREKVLESARAAEAEYASLIDRVRRRLVDRPTGWIADNLSDIKRALSLGLPGKDVVGIRSDLATTLGGGEWYEAKVIRTPDRVEKIAYSPHKKILALGASGFREEDSFFVKLLDAETFEETASVDIPKKPVKKEPAGSSLVEGVWSLKFSRNSKFLFVGTRSGWIHRLDMANPLSLPISWKAHEYRVDKMATSPDGARLFTLCRSEQKLSAWSVIDCTEIASRTVSLDDLSEERHVSTSLNCNSDYLMVSSEGLSSLKWYDPSTLQEISKKKILDQREYAPEQIRAVRFSSFSDADIAIFACSSDVWLWDSRFMRTTTRVMIDNDYMMGSETVRSVAIDQTARMAAISLVSKIIVWDTVADRMDAALVPPVLDNFAREIEFRDSSEMVIPGEPVVIYKRSQSRVVFSTPPQAEYATAFSLFHSGLLAMASRMGNFRHTSAIAYSKFDDKLASTLFSSENHIADALVLTVSPDGNRVIFIKNYKLHVYDINLAKVIKIVDCSQARYEANQSIMFDGMNTIWITQGSWISRLNIASGKYEVTLKWDRRSPDNSDGQYWCIEGGSKIMLAGNRDGHVDFFKPEAEEFHNHLLIDSSSGITSISVDQSEKLAAIGTNAGKVAFIETENPQILHQWQAHTNQRVTSVSLNPNASLLASGGNDGKLHIWKRKGDKWELYFDIPTDKKPVRQVQFDEAGKKLYYLLSGERGVRVWDMERFVVELKDYGLAEN